MQNKLKENYQTNDDPNEQEIQIKSGDMLEQMIVDEEKNKKESSKKPKVKRMEKLLLEKNTFRFLFYICKQ